MTTIATDDFSPPSSPPPLPTPSSSATREMFANDDDDDNDDDPVQRYYARWMLCTNGGAVDPVHHALRIFFGRDDDAEGVLDAQRHNRLGTYITETRLHNVYRRAMGEFIADIKEGVAAGRYNDADGQMRIRKVIVQMQESRNLLTSMMRISRNNDSSMDASLLDTGDETVHILMDLFESDAAAADLKKDFKPLQQFVLMIGNDFKERNLRVYKKNRLFQRHLVFDQESNAFVDTLHWEEVGTIDDFVWDMVKSTNHDHFLVGMENGTIVPNTIRFWTNGSADAKYLPELVKDRHLFAFRNGVYHTSTNRFFRNNNADDLMALKTDIYGNRPRIEAAANYFDVEFDAAWTDVPNWWQGIPTPALDKLVGAQFTVPSPEVALHTDEDRSAVIGVLMAVLGRLFYSVGEMDAWEIFPFLKGVAGSGKSTLCKLVQSFYPPEDVGIMSNTHEEKFGLSALYQSMLAIGPELGLDCRVPQTDIQTMTSGEATSVKVKSVTAVNLPRWTVPFMAAGNVIPETWTDNSGSMQRRMLLFLYDAIIDPAKSDTDLEDKLKREMAGIICKLNRAYLALVQRAEKQSLWNVLPNYFHKTREILAISSNSLLAFVFDQGEILCADNRDEQRRLARQFILETPGGCPNMADTDSIPPDLLYVSEADFRKSYNLYCQTRHIQAMKWRLDEVRTTLNGLKLMVVACTYKETSSSSAANADSADSNNGTTRVVVNRAPSSVGGTKRRRTPSSAATSKNTATTNYFFGCALATLYHHHHQQQQQQHQQQ